MKDKNAEKVNTSGPLLPWLSTMKLAKQQLLNVGDEDRAAIIEKKIKQAERKL